MQDMFFIESRDAKEVRLQKEARELRRLISQGSDFQPSQFLYFEEAMARANMDELRESIARAYA